MDDASPSSRASVDSLLAWWADAGLDAMVDEGPRDWLKAPPPPPPPVEARDAPPAVPEAKPAAPLPGTLAAFTQWLATDDGLPFAAPGVPRIGPSGDPQADLMILAPMPSQADLAAGALLSGPDGRLFDRMLAAIGKSRETVYLAPLSGLRPPGGRIAPAELEALARIARHHVDLVRPRILLLLGSDGTRALTGLNAPQARGKTHAIALPGGDVDAIVTMTPDFLIGQPSAKALAWADLRLVMESLSCQPGSPSSP